MTEREQDQVAGGDEGILDDFEVDVLAETEASVSLDAEVPVADAVEQHQPVPVVDEDDYR